MYTVDYFIKKFQAIPEENWLVGDYQNEDKTKFCALGHCGGTSNSFYNKDNKEYSLLSEMCLSILNRSIVNINDGTCPRTFPQSTPKKRVLAALLQIKAKLQPIEISDPPITAEELISSLPAIEELQLA
jgi:hypothetical protein